MRTLLLLWLWGAPARAQAPEAPEASSAPMKDEDAGKPLAEPPLGAPPSDEEVTQRTDQLASELRCPVCQGLSVAASPSEAARAMRDRIHELVALGYGDQQIVDYFVGRYGTWVLLEPPKQGLTWLLWLGPAAAVGGGLLWVAFGAGRKKAAAPAPEAGVEGAAEADAYRARVLAELGETQTKREDHRS